MILCHHEWAQSLFKYNLIILQTSALRFDHLKKKGDLFFEMVDMDKGVYGQEYNVSLFIHVSYLYFHLRCLCFHLRYLFIHVRYMQEPKHHGVMDKSYDVFIHFDATGPGFESRFGLSKKSRSIYSFVRFVRSFELIRDER